MTTEVVTDTRPWMESRLEAVHGSDDFDSQYTLFHQIMEYGCHTEALVRSCLDFGTDETASSSLLVRAAAIECGVRSLRRSAIEGLLSPDLAALRTRLVEQVPEYFNISDLIGAAQMNDDQVFSYHPYTGAYNRLWRVLCEREGVNEKHLLDTRGAAENDGIEPFNAVPVFVGAMIDRMVDEDSPVDGSKRIPEGLIVPTVSMAIDQFSALYKGEAPPQGANELAQFHRLARFIDVRKGKHNFEHDGPIEFLYQLPDRDRTPYIRVFNALYESAQKIRGMFPSEFDASLVDGARGLIANALFAVAEHIRNGKVTDTAIPLARGIHVPLRLVGDQPLELLRILDAAFRKGHKDVLGEHAHAMRSVEGDGFTIHRFIDPTSPQPPATSLTIREEGVARRGGGRYQYGRPEVGISATMSYVVVMNPDELPSLIVSKKPTTAIRFGIDREGRPPGPYTTIQDPEAYIGTASFDVCSVAGKDDDVGTMLGRLLFRGNMLRSRAVQEVSEGNHITAGIDQRFGRADVFRGLAVGLRHSVEAGGLIDWRQLREWSQDYGRWPSVRTSKS